MSQPPAHGIDKSEGHGVNRQVAHGPGSRPWLGVTSAPDGHPLNLLAQLGPDVLSPAVTANPDSRLASFYDDRQDSWGNRAGDYGFWRVIASSAASARVATPARPLEPYAAYGLIPDPC